MSRILVTLFAFLPLALTSCRSPIEQDRTVAVLWWQSAAEARALYYQAFNIARQRLDEALLRRIPSENLAVIVDLDETVIDNGAFEGTLVKEGRPFSDKDWNSWSLRGEAGALPGAQPFLAYAASNNVSVFYISNRHTGELEATARNLKALHFPTVDAEHLLLQAGKEGKEPRRRKIAADYKIVLLMGDNLGDFAGFFERQPAASRLQLTDENRANFGRIFIVLPNPMYGGWEDCLYPPGLTERQKSDLRRSLVRGEK